MSKLDETLVIGNAEPESSATHFQSGKHPTTRQGLLVGKAWQRNNNGPKTLHKLKANNSSKALLIRATIAVDANESNLLLPQIIALACVKGWTLNQPQLFFFTIL